MKVDRIGLILRRTFSFVSLRLEIESVGRRASGVGVRGREGSEMQRIMSPAKIETSENDGNRGRRIFYCFQ